jgi:hypothetical protein
MLQFDQYEIENIRARATPEIIDKLVKDNDVVLNSKTLVPPDNRATWNLFYYCPHHGVRLVWDRYNASKHKCPVDDVEFSGEPYDGAWWRWLNELNAKACYELGLLWQLTQEERYLSKVKDILLQYAIKYPHYEVHGDIPYNGPGKANAQTLCEANFHLNLSRGYDFIRDDIFDFERQKIEHSLLRQGAEFLIAHRSPQLHNHEIRISAAVGVIGLLLEETRYVNFALISDFGLHYQLNHGCIGEGMWFEGSIHYHYYALQSLLAFEKIAYKTEHSISGNPNFLKMLKFPLELIMSNGNFPALNDCIAGQERVIQSEVFEFGYREYPFPLLQQALQYIYTHEERHNLEALLYGVEALNPIAPLSCQANHSPYSGYTTEVNQQDKHYLLVKHAPFGGEHDHYDRLSIVLCRFGQEILPDLGTTGYGADLHNSYYKNSASHNTLVVNEGNQPPINPECLYYDKNDSYCLVDLLADWNSPPAEVDSHTIKQWDEHDYRNVVYRRTLIWFHDCLLDISTVNNPHNATLDVTYLTRGRHKMDVTWQSVQNPVQGALSCLTECHNKLLRGSEDVLYKIENQDDFKQSIYTNSRAHLIKGYAPDNPATSDIAYLLIRSEESYFSSLVLHDLHGDNSITAVDWQGRESIQFTIDRHGKRTRYQFNFASSKLAFI